MTPTEKIPTTINISKSMHDDIERAILILAEDDRLACLDLKPAQVLKMALSQGLKQIIGDAP